MAVHFVDILFRIKGLEAIFTTLAHSLWLGMVMAFVAGIIVLVTRRSGAMIRYRLLAGLLALFLISMVFIFFSTMASTATLPSAAKVFISLPVAESKEAELMSSQKSTFINTAFTFIAANANTLVWIWYIVMCFKCMRLFSGVRALQRLKKINIVAADERWVNRMNELGGGLRLKKEVALLQSYLAKVPMVIGHLKPLILFPVGMLNALPPGEVEAILVHELAHIKRNDFLINLVQQFTEMFFFFNPGVLWVSSLLKNERENCCDDIALSITHDKKKFIQALVAFQEYNEGLSYSTLFPGATNHLLHRVKRIITNRNKTLNNMEKLVLASGIIITGLVALSFSSGQKSSKNEGMNTASPVLHSLIGRRGNNIARKSIMDATSIKNVQEIKSLPAILPVDTSFKRSYQGVIDGKKIALTEDNNRITSLYISGQKIAKDQYSRYASLIKKVHESMEDNIADLKTQAGADQQARENQQQAEELQEAQLMQEAQQMQEAEEMQEAQEMQEAEEMQEAQEMHEAEEIKNAEELEKQHILLKKDFSRQEKLMKQQYMEMQRRMKKSVQNEDMVKKQFLRSQLDFTKQQKLMKVEFEKAKEKMQLHREEFRELMKDSIKLKGLSKMKTRVYAVTKVVAEEGAFASGVLVKSEVIATPAADVVAFTYYSPEMYLSDDVPAVNN